jgi:hypothetical protein
MLQFFETSFRPAASKQPGYIELKMLKLTSTLRGPAPEGANFRFVLEFKKRRVAAEMGGIGHSPEAVAEYRGHAYQQKLYSIVV